VGSGSTGGRNTRWSEYLKIIHPDDRERYLATVAAAWEQRACAPTNTACCAATAASPGWSSHGKTLADCERQGATA
jgi:hypothetical protein